MFLASGTFLATGIVMIVLGVVTGVCLLFWMRNVRKAGRRAGMRRETVLLVFAIGLALTAVFLLIGILVVLNFFN